MALISIRPLIITIGTIVTDNGKTYAIITHMCDGQIIIFIGRAGMIDFDNAIRVNTYCIIGGFVVDVYGMSKRLLRPAPRSVGKQIF